jgi:hypothetical protein
MGGDKTCGQRVENGYPNPIHSTYGMNLGPFIMERDLIGQLTKMRTMGPPRSSLCNDERIGCRVAFMVPLLCHPRSENIVFSLQNHHKFCVEDGTRK